MFVFVPYILVFVVKGYQEFPTHYKTIRGFTLLLFLIWSGYFYISRAFIFGASHLNAALYIRDNPPIRNVFYFMSSFRIPMYSVIHRYLIKNLDQMFGYHSYKIPMSKLFK